MSYLLASTGELLSTGEPSGLFHAYLPENDLTACGDDHDDMHLWPDRVFGPHEANACATCSDIARATPQLSE